MLTAESIIRYKNFKIREDETVSLSDLKSKMAKNQRILDISYIALYSVMFAILLTFVVTEIVCTTKSCDLKGSYFGPAYLSISNIVVWVMLLISTFSFLSMLNKRFGEEEFKGPKNKLRIFLAIFSLSFLIRGTWDAVLSMYGFDLHKNERLAAALIFIVYFFTEWLPIFVIYLSHFTAFYAIKHRSSKKRGKKRENGQVGEESPSSQNLVASDDMPYTK